MNQAIVYVPLLVRPVWTAPQVERELTALFARLPDEEPWLKESQLEDEMSPVPPTGCWAIFGRQ